MRNKILKVILAIVCICSVFSFSTIANAAVLNDDAVLRCAPSTGSDIAYIMSEGTDLNITAINTFKTYYGLEEYWATVSLATDDVYMLIDKSETQQLGEFKITTYCDDVQSNGKWYGFPAKNGEPLIVGYTIAVDPDVIPLNSWVLIDGVGWRKACDTGSAVKGDHIDLLVGGYTEADGYGTTFRDVMVLE